MTYAYRLLVSGTRSGRPDVESVLDAHVAEHGKPFLVIICGDWDEKKNRATFRGVDRQAREWAKRRGLKFIEVLAHWEMHGDAAGPIRNTYAVGHCFEGDHCVAIPDPTGPSKGTRGCAALAERAGLRVFMHEVKR